MTNNNLRESVKTPSMIVSFENRKINVFLHELIIGGAYKDAFELIFSKAYYNLDFFLDGTLPSSAKIGTVRDNMNEPPTQQTNETSLPDSALNDKLDALTKAVSEIGKTQEDSHQTIESMMKTIENLLTKNSELVSILSELQGTMKETKEGLQVLNKFEGTGINLSQVIEQNKSLPEQVAKELPAKEPIKRNPPPSDNASGAVPRGAMAEAKSIFDSGLFSKIKTSGDSDEEGDEEKLDMSAIIARMKRGQPDI